LCVYDAYLAEGDEYAMVVGKVADSVRSSQRSVQVVWVAGSPEETGVCCVARDRAKRI
jgi:hypothetical protein